MSRKRSRNDQDHPGQRDATDISERELLDNKIDLLENARYWNQQDLTKLTRELDARLWTPPKLHIHVRRPNLLPRRLRRALKPAWATAHFLAYPEHQAICARRKIRRVMMFVKKLAGKGKAGPKRKKRTRFSNVKC